MINTHELCTALKRIINNLKPNEQPLSCVLILGNEHQGKSVLLKQSSLKHVQVGAIDLYHSQYGICIIFNKSLSAKNIAPILKQINRRIQISGIILCVDIQNLLIEADTERQQIYAANAKLLNQTLHILGYTVDITLIFTKTDVIAGFCDFFQYEHANDLQQPLGFSITHNLNEFNHSFDLFIESISQRVLDKIHPARGSLKRTLIREFPLQLASLRSEIKHLLNTLTIHVNTIYFTSAQQGAQSIDKLHVKIQNEYALILPNQNVQATNYRAYFIEGTINSVLMQTARYKPKIHTLQRKFIIYIVTITLASILWFGQNTLQTLAKLEDAQHALQTYLSLHKHPQHTTAAVYQLTQAKAIIDTMPMHTPKIVKTLQDTVAEYTNNAVQQQIMPQLLSIIERKLMNPHSTYAMRYSALKIYLMLGNQQYFIKQSILDWFKHNAHLTVAQQELLTQVLQTAHLKIPLNQRLISNTRNDLNAMPLNYLYYNLAKSYLPRTTTNFTLDGFELTHTAVPSYFTKAEFLKTIENLNQISRKLQAENWVLERQDLQQLPTLLKQAYYADYIKWWQQFMHHSMPKHTTQYTEILQLMQLLNRTHAFTTLTQYIQQQTKPELDKQYTKFNRAIASQFSAVNLMSISAVHQLTRTMSELEQLIRTLSVVNDQGRSAFIFAKARFSGDHFINPLKSLYYQVEQFPEPISLWAKQIADDIWVALLNDSRRYINYQWQHIVYPEYAASIAHRYPFDHTTANEINLNDFNHFFATHGTLNNFIQEYLKAFLDTRNAAWTLKQVNQYVLPIPETMQTELMRANVITNMFFPMQTDVSRIQFSLQKINLDPVIARLRLTIGETKLSDMQTSESITNFIWPTQDAKLVLNTIDGKHYELTETGPWAFFKLLQQVNVLVDDNDASNLHILFEVNGNSGRYLLKTNNKVNPFIPGILNDFVLMDTIV